jgi:hypothetical protein
MISFFSLPGKNQLYQLYIKSILLKAVRLSLSKPLLQLNRLRQAQADNVI